MFKKFLILFLVFISVFLLVSCKSKDNNPAGDQGKDPETKEIKEIKASSKSKLEYEDSNINGLILEIIYNNDEKEEITVTKDLIKTDLSTLKGGNNTISVEYEGKTIEFNVTISQSIEDLMEEYYLVILIENQDGNSKITFCSEQETYGINFALNGVSDSSNMTLISQNILKNSEEKVDLGNIFYVNSDNSQLKEEILSINGTKLTENSIEIKEFYVLTVDELVKIPNSLVKVVVK